MGRPKLYTDEERKEKEKEWRRNWIKNNPEKNKESKKKYIENNHEKVKEASRKSSKKYAENHKEKISKYQKFYFKTKNGRASNLLSSYRKNDELYSRGECTLTAKWIVDNIFSQPCHYCGETDWHLLGCDRINNDLPHTPDNVVPCCMKCNWERGTTDYNEFKK